MTKQLDDAITRIRLLPDAQQDAAAALLLDLLRQTGTPPARNDGQTNVPGRYATGAQIDSVFKSLSR